MSDRGRHLAITSEGVTGKVELDGVDIANGIRSLVLTMRAGELPTLQIDPLILSSEVIESHFVHTTVDERAHAVLVSLGWTPPCSEPGAET